MAANLRSESPEFILAQFLFRNGCIRQSNPERLLEGPGRYKKGCEVRLVAYDAGELAQMRSLLDVVGLRAGKPYTRWNQLVQPVYGRQAVDAFLSWCIRWKWAFEETSRPRGRYRELLDG
jgi:hypothetical protein